MNNYKNNNPQNRNVNKDWSQPVKKQEADSKRKARNEETAKNIRDSSTFTIMNNNF